MVVAVQRIVDVQQFMPVCFLLLLPGQARIDDDNRFIIGSKTDKPVNLHG